MQFVQFGGSVGVKKKKENQKGKEEMPNKPEYIHKKMYGTKMKGN